MDDKIFNEEQKHLDVVYGRLEDMKEALEKDLAGLYDKAQREKKNLRDDLTLNFDSDTDSIETYIEFESLNHVIDSLNVQSDIENERLERVNHLLESPYFARVTLRFDPDEEPEDFYIGRTGISEGSEIIVVDWRSPIAETYYNQAMGQTSYEVDGQKIPVELLLRRQFDLERDQLHSYFDTTIAIEDALLLKSLSSRRSDHMQDITATIQKEQNQVIRHKDVPVLLVNGIAGSGKTSVLLQRIAYLLYRKRKTLKPQNVYLMTLNPVFDRYIENVLPDLGEQNPVTMTWTDFEDYAGVPDERREETSADSLRKLEEGAVDLSLQPEDFLPIGQKGSTVLSEKQIAKTVLKNAARIPVSPRLMSVSADELRENASLSIRRKTHDLEDRKTRKHTEAAVLADQLAEAGSEEKAENIVQNQFGGAFAAIAHFDWLNIERIGCRILGKDHLTAMEYYYLRMILTGECEKNAQYVCIDEVQDYSEAQIMVLQKYFVNARFMMLGDEFQAIRPGLASFADISRVFEKNGKSVDRLSLMTSYRSSPEITKLFTSLLPKNQQIETKSVQRPGFEPDIRAFQKNQDYETALREAVKASESEDGTTAIVCADRDSILRTEVILGADTPEILEGDRKPPKQGPVLVELVMAKGLEFDHVIIPDGDAETYPDDTLSRHRFYTAISRATQKLTVLARGKLTKLAT